MKEGLVASSNRNVLIEGEQQKSSIHFRTLKSALYFHYLFIRHTSRARPDRPCDHPPHNPSSSPSAAGFHQQRTANQRCTDVNLRHKTHEESSATTMNNSPFARLAPELRNHIYELALTDDAPVVVKGHIPASAFGPPQVWALTNSRQLALTQTCGQIREETVQMFHTSNAFTVLVRTKPCQYVKSDAEDDTMSLLGMLNSLIMSMRKHECVYLDAETALESYFGNTSRVRAIKIEMGNVHVERGDAIKRQLEQLRGWAKDHVTPPLSLRANFYGSKAESFTIVLDIRRLQDSLEAVLADLTGSYAADVTLALRMDVIPILRCVVQFLIAFHD